MTLNYMPNSFSRAHEVSISPNLSVSLNHYYGKTRFIFKQNNIQIAVDKSKVESWINNYDAKLNVAKNIDYLEPYKGPRIEKHPDYWLLSRIYDSDSFMFNIYISYNDFKKFVNLYWLSFGPYL
jgi:hypothetical protein